jgi:hypothetical protein
VASEIQIINRGLSDLGADRISDRSDNCKEAREMDACYDEVLAAELRAHNWRFSLTRAALSALSTTPAFQYEFEYQLPTDCLKVIQVGQTYIASQTDYRLSDEAHFVIEGRKILTNRPAPLNIRYVRKLTAGDAQTMDASFVVCMAARLAITTCKAITASSSQMDDLRELYKARLNEASLADAIETAPAVLADDSWLIARL